MANQSTLANRLHCGNSECTCTRNEAAAYIEKLEAQNKELLEALQKLRAPMLTASEAHRIINKALEGENSHG